MLRVRPVRLADQDAVLGLARIAGIGMSSLPQDADVLRGKILHSEASFQGTLAEAKQENFLFVMEDMEQGRLVGTTGITTHVGLKRPFYSYKRSTLTQASQALGIYSLHHVLHMVNDYTDATEIGSLFLLPDYRHDGGGRFLSRCRYLMLAQFPELFSDVVISEIRGVQDAQGNAPFYNHLARHFFQMEFREADYIYATQGAQFIADLMPKYPIYVNLLAQEAQDVIAVPLAASRPAMRLLQEEGFRHEGYIDLFDAGPTLEVDRADIRTVRDSRMAPVAVIAPLPAMPLHLISNTHRADFTMVCQPLVETPTGLHITPASAEALGVKVGEAVRYVR